jgi:glutamate--cysteine ligase
MTMFFPDARTKRYIEIRMMDSIPYPLNLAAVALVKGLFYSESNLNELYDFSKTIKAEDVVASKLELLEKGMEARLNGRTILDIGKWMTQMSKSVLNDEAVYIEPLERLLEEGKNPYLLTKELYKEGDRRNAIDWAILRR